MECSLCAGHSCGSYLKDSSLSGVHFYQVNLSHTVPTTSSSSPYISRCAESDVETVAVQEDCLQILLSLTYSPAGLHLLLSSGCMLVAARLLVGGGGCRSSVRKLVEAMVAQPSVVARHSEMIGEVVSILATEFRANQVEVVGDVWWCCSRHCYL